MLWDMVFLAFAVTHFLVTFFLIRWGHDNRMLGDMDTWKFTNLGSGGV